MDEKNTEGRLAEVVSEFEIVKPGEVYPTLIEEGEVVDGRVAEVGVQLECAIWRDETEASEKAKAAAAEKTKGDASEKSAQAPQIKMAEPSQNKEQA